VGRGALWGDAPELWSKSFAAVAAAARALAEKAACLGVRVHENATLNDLAGLFENCQVVTVVAHWRGPQISKQDIIMEPTTVIHRLAGDTCDLVVRIRGGFPVDWRDRLDALETDGARRSRLAELLDSRMSQPPALAKPPAGTEWHMDEITLRHQNRAALDAWWPEAFKTGNQLELADGLHSPEAISAIVPEHWTGVADLSNCQSAQLINEIKQYRAERIVIANELETNPLRRLSLLSVIYDLLSHREANYLDVRIAMAARMTRETLEGRHT
jgi:hypothetical protein